MEESKGFAAGWGDSLAGDAFEGGAGGGVEFFGHTAGEEGFAAGFGAFAHGRRHEDGVGGAGDGGVEKDGVEAHLHGEGGVGGGAQAGVDDEGDLGNELAEHAQGVGVADAEAGADGGAEGHDGGGTDVDEALGKDNVVSGVRENGEAFLD